MLSMLPQPESYYQDLIHQEIGGVKEYQLEDRTRVDILTRNRAIEIDWQNKWAEGVGQSIYYSVKTSRPPLVILLATSPSWPRYEERVEACGVECWVYSVDAEEFIKY